MTVLGQIALALAVVAGGGDGIAVSDAHVAPGDTFTVSGAGCEPDSDVNLFLDGEIFARTRADATGGFVAPATIADTVGAGDHRVTAIGSGCGATATVTVRSPSSSSSDSSNLVVALAIQLAAVLVAITIVVASRRRWPDEVGQADSAE